jgi:hypothetical protein
MEAKTTGNRQQPWNKGKLIGQKAPFKFKEILDYAARCAPGDPSL